MSDFLAALSEGPLLSDGAMGSLLFARTGRLSEANHVYEALNIDNPDLVREVHYSYLRAGARCLTTNTFGANRASLAPLDEAGRVVEINRAGARLARDAAREFLEESGAEGPIFVLGSVGPPLAEYESHAALQDEYRQQLDALASEGVDAILMETFTSLDHVRVVLQAAQAVDDSLPVIVQMALHQDTPGGTWSEDPAAFVDLAASLGARVAGFNCCAPWEALAFAEAAADAGAVREGRVLLSAMPNAGGFQRIGHRYMTQVNPEYMGRLARSFGQLGVRLIGGCCEVHPPHLAEMRSYLIAQTAGASAAVRPSASGRVPAGNSEKRLNGGFSRKITDGEFAVSVEMLPARGTSASVFDGKADFVAELAASGLADALDVTDGSRGVPLMPPGDFISAVRERLGWTAQTGDGLEFIPHFTSRDLNLLGVQSRLIGYHVNRIRNVVFITGDPPKMSPTYPRSTGVFDLDSVAMVRYAHSSLNAGLDFGGQPLGRGSDPGTRFTIGSGFEPEAIDRSQELERLQQKIDSGADYIMTQPAFHHDVLDVLEPFRPRVAILVGVMICASLAHALRVGQIPGVVVPREVLERLDQFESPEDQAKEGRAIATEAVRAVVAGGWSGLYLMSPAGHRHVLPVLEAGLA